MDEPGKYLDVTSCAAYLCLSVSFVQKLVGRRRIPFVRIGRRIIFDKAQIDRWASRRQVLPRDWGTGGTA